MDMENLEDGDIDLDLDVDALLDEIDDDDLADLLGAESASVDGCQLSPILEPSPTPEVKLEPIENEPTTSPIKVENRDTIKEEQTLRQPKQEKMPDPVVAPASAPLAPPPSSTTKLKNADSDDSDLEVIFEDIVIQKPKSESPVPRIIPKGKTLPINVTTTVPVITPPIPTPMPTTPKKTEPSTSSSTSISKPKIQEINFLDVPPDPPTRKDKDKDKDKNKKSSEFPIDHNSSLEARKKNKIALHPEYEKYKSKFKLMPISCTVIEINTIVNLKPHMILKTEKLKRIETIDRKAQIRVNNKERKISVPWSSKSSNVTTTNKKKNKKNKATKKHKKVYTVSSSASSGGSSSSSSISSGIRPAPPKKGKFDHQHHKSSSSTNHALNSSKDIYSSTGTRILPFEKKHKDLVSETNRIRRPKADDKPQLDESTKSNNKKGMQRDKEFRVDKPSKALTKVLEEAAKAKETNRLFKIPKKNEPPTTQPSVISERDREPPKRDPPAWARDREPPSLYGRRDSSSILPSSSTCAPSTSTNFRPGAPFPPRRIFPQYRGDGQSGSGLGRPGQGFGFQREQQPLRWNTDYPQENYSPWHLKPGDVPKSTSPRKPPPPPRYNNNNAPAYRDRHLPQHQQQQPLLHPREDDMHDPPGSDNDEDEPRSTPPAPINEPSSPYVGEVVHFLRNAGPNRRIELPTQRAISDSPAGQVSAKQQLVRKLAWWFQSSEREVPPRLIDSPEDFDFAINLDDNEYEDRLSDFGNVSNPDGDEDELKDSDLARRDDADVQDEYCGAGLLHASYRIGTLEENKFQNIFDLRPGSSYEKASFQARCTLCDNIIIGTRNLGTHVRSELHRQNFKIIYQNLIYELENQIQNEENSMKRNNSHNNSHEKEDERDKIDRVPRDPSTLQLDQFIRQLSEKNSAQGPSSSGPKREPSTVNGSFYSPTGSVGHIMTPSPEQTLPKSTAKAETDKSRKSRSKSRDRDRNRDQKRDRDRRRRTRSRTRSRSRDRDRDRRRRRKTRSRSRSRNRSRSRDRDSRGRHRQGRSSSISKKHDRERDRGTRETSAERVAKFLKRTNSTTSSSSNHRDRRSPGPTPKQPSGIKTIFPTILKLQHAGKWTDLLAEKYRRCELEEKQVSQEMHELRSRLNEKPETHETYEAEWNMYWKTKYQEVMKENKNPDNYDYIPGWKVFWNLKVETLVQQKHERIVNDIRKRYEFDEENIQKLLSTSGSSGFSSGAPLPVPPPPLPDYQPPIPILPPPPSRSDSGIGQFNMNQYNPMQMDDLNTRPMSLASASFDGSLESGEVKSPPEVLPVPPPAPIIHNQPLPPQPPQPFATLDTFTAQWEKLTGQKIQVAKGDGAGCSSSAVSAISSGPMSIASGGSGPTWNDLDVNIVELLEGMLGISDQLSILGSKVESYLAEAQELERQGSHKSRQLLNRKEFCKLLIEVRKRFLKLVLASNQPTTVLKKLNYLLFILTEIITSEPCSKWAALDERDSENGKGMNEGGCSSSTARPGPAPVLAAPIIPNPIPTPRPNRNFPSSSSTSQSVQKIVRPLAFTLPPQLHPSLLPKVQSIQESLRQIPLHVKEQVGRLISFNLEVSQNYPLTDADLVDYVHSLVIPRIGPQPEAESSPVHILNLQPQPHSPINQPYRQNLPSLMGLSVQQPQPNRYNNNPRPRGSSPGPGPSRAGAGLGEWDQMGPGSIGRGRGHGRGHGGW